MASVNPLNVLRILNDIYAKSNHVSTPVTAKERALADYVQSVLDDPGSLLSGSHSVPSKRPSSALYEYDVSLESGFDDPMQPVAKRTDRRKTELPRKLQLSSTTPSLATKNRASSTSVVVLQTDTEAVPEEDDVVEVSDIEGEDNEDDTGDKDYRDPQDIEKEEAEREAAERAKRPKNIHATLNIEPVSFDYKRRCVAYYRSGLTKQRKKLLSFKHLNNRYPRCRSTAMLQRWENTLQIHDERVSKLVIIQDMVLEEIRKATESGVVEITDEDIRQMALQANEEVECDIFSASQSWMEKFKHENQEAAPANQTWSIGLPGMSDEEKAIEEDDLREVEEDVAENLAVKQLPETLPANRGKKQWKKPVREDPDGSLVERTRKNTVYALLMGQGEAVEYKQKVIDFWTGAKKKKRSWKAVLQRYRLAGKDCRNVENFMKKHGEEWEKLKKITLFILQRIAEARSNGTTFIGNGFIRDQALEANQDVGLEYFGAKKAWVRNFKMLNKDYVPNEKIWPDHSFKASGPVSTATGDDDFDSGVVAESETAVGD